MLHPSDKEYLFERRPVSRRAFERRLEVFDLSLALIVFILAALLVSGCQPQAQQPAGPRLRITNNRDTMIHNLVVIFPNDRVEFGDIGPNATSEYLPVPKGVYAYAAYELEVDGKVVTQPVIDWVGESPVEGQDFTWLIDVEPNRGPMGTVQIVKATVDK